MIPNFGQLILLGVAAAFFAVGGAVSLARLWRESEAWRIAAKACLYTGLSAAIGVIAWHSISRGQWQPMSDNFESLIWLAVLLTLFVMYVQWRRPIGGLDSFVMPIVVVLLLAAGIFGRLDFHEYQRQVRDTWLWVHWVSAYGGAAALAIAAAGGAMYIVASKKLRQKTGGPKLGSLERVEHLMMGAVTLGFALLTVGLVTGLIRWMAENQKSPPMAKILLAFLAWVVYAIVLHAPWNPRFRGRRAAILSVFGFLLMVGTLIAVQFMSGGQG